MSSEDIYIAGRYNKYLRSLSQSPWIDKADKRIKNSVQELIEEGLKEFLQLGGSRLVFSSSGREDVDVRMLGRGRPFCFRVTQPWSEPTPNGYTFNQETLSKIQKFINKKHAGKIQVRDLQLVSRQDVAKQLREGSESKTKEYRALCCSSRPISNEEVERLNQMCEFDIEQNTPIRVLHRRTISARRRRIHKMKLEREANLKEFSLNLTRGGGVRKLIDDQDDEEINRLFVLTLITEAGTYIKEFVHGDFGRTEPNLASLLKDCDTDLIELDVMEVNLDWPPSLTDSSTNRNNESKEEEQEEEEGGGGGGVKGESESVAKEEQLSAQDGPKEEPEPKRICLGST